MKTNLLEVILMLLCAYGTNGLLHFAHARRQQLRREKLLLDGIMSKTTVEFLLKSIK